MTNYLAKEYYIDVTASIKNDTYTESYKSRFKLTVLPEKL